MELDSVTTAFEEKRQIQHKENKVSCIYFQQWSRWGYQSILRAQRNKESRTEIMTLLTGHIQVD